MLVDGTVEPQVTGDQRFAAQLRQRQVDPVVGGAARLTRVAPADALELRAFNGTAGRDGVLVRRTYVAAAGG